MMIIIAIKIIILQMLIYLMKRYQITLKIQNSGATLIADAAKETKLKPLVAEKQEKSEVFLNKNSHNKKIPRIIDAGISFIDSTDKNTNTTNLIANKIDNYFGIKNNHDKKSVTIKDSGICLVNSLAKDNLLPNAVGEDLQECEKNLRNLIRDFSNDDNNNIKKLKTKESDRYLDIISVKITNSDNVIVEKGKKDENFFVEKKNNEKPLKTAESGRYYEESSIKVINSDNILVKKEKKDKNFFVEKKHVEKSSITAESGRYYEDSSMKVINSETMIVKKEEKDENFFVRKIKNEKTVKTTESGLYFEILLKQC